MIVEWLMDIVKGLSTFFASLFPDWSMPPELADPNGMLAGIFALGQGMEPFVNWPLVTALGAIPPAVWVIGILWKFLRQGFSHFPGIGGNG